MNAYLSHSNSRKCTAAVACKFCFSIFFFFFHGRQVLGSGQYMTVVTAECHRCQVGTHRIRSLYIIFRNKFQVYVKN